MADLVEVVEELGKVDLSPIMVPTLKVVDPVMGALPKGSLQSMLSRKETRDSLVSIVEALAPALPALIRFMGRVAESRLAVGLVSLWASMAAPIMELLAPVSARLVVPLSGPALRSAGYLARRLSR